MKVKIILPFVLLTTFVYSQTQKPLAPTKELSLSDAVMKQGRDFRPDNLPSPSWIPGKEEFVYAADRYQTLKKGTIKSSESFDFLKLSDVNAALGSKLPNFFGYSWKSVNEMYLSDGMMDDETATQVFIVSMALTSLLSRASA